jgi:hypothetical protein
MKLYKQLFAKQLGQNYKDFSLRGNGNKSARRAFLTMLGGDKNLRSNINEPIAEYPRIITRGSILTDCCKSKESAKFSNYSY